MPFSLSLFLSQELGSIRTEGHLRRTTWRRPTGRKCRQPLVENDSPGLSSLRGPLMLPTDWWMDELVLGGGICQLFGLLFSFCRGYSNRVGANRFGVTCINCELN